VLEGEGELYIDGEAIRKLKAGDGFIIPAGKAHDAKNTGTVPLKLVGVYVVEKGKPLATPVK
jgi:mannose-6-phosphate isomerase-like protein (cupin superfamily)